MPVQLPHPTAVPALPDCSFSGANEMCIRDRCGIARSSAGGSFRSNQSQIVSVFFVFIFVIISVLLPLFLRWCFFRHRTVRRLRLHNSYIFLFPRNIPFFYYFIKTTSSSDSLIVLKYPAISFLPSSFLLLSFCLSCRHCRRISR